MTDSVAMVDNLTTNDLILIGACGEERNFNRGDIVFSETDPVDAFYIIQSGLVAIFIDKSGKAEEVCTLNQGEYFGEMAIFDQNKRAASVVAMEDTTLLSVDKADFLDFVSQYPTIAEKIYSTLAQRNEELVLRENLIGITGIDTQGLHVSIKGDPSLRESAFVRERYESVVDKILDQLEPSLEDLLLNRCVYRIYIGFNNGEIRISTVFDPFNEEIHTANKLIDKAYINRHFSFIPYEDKTNLVKGIYEFISQDLYSRELPSHWSKIFRQRYDNWQPLTKEKITAVMTKLADLRNIPDFYLRNVTVSIMQDAIRMQFNCDGTHIVSTGDYEKFLQENI